MDRDNRTAQNMPQAPPPPPQQQQQQVAMEAEPPGNLLGELGLVPGVEILQTDFRDFFAEQEAPGSGLLDLLAAEDEITLKEMAAWFQEEDEDPQSNPPAQQLSEASTSADRVLVTDASTSTTPQRILELTSRVIPAPHPRQNELQWRQWQHWMLCQRWQAMAPVVPAPMMSPQVWMIAAQLPQLTPLQSVTVGPQLCIFGPQVPLQGLQFPMLVPPTMSIPRPRLKPPAMKLPAARKHVAPTKRRHWGLHHILWVDEDKNKNPRRSSRMLEWAARKNGAGICAFTIAGSLGSQGYRTVLGRKWALVVIYLERERSKSGCWEKWLSILKKICLTTGAPYPMVVALYAPQNAAAHLPLARRLLASGLIADAGLYPENATQLGQFLDRFLCPQLAGASPWAMAMQKPPTRVQRAVTKFAAFGTRIVRHQHPRAEHVYFNGPAFSNSRFSLVVCNQPPYLVVAIEGYCRRREAPIRPKRVLEEPQIFVATQSVKRKKDDDGNLPSQFQATVQPASIDALHHTTSNQALALHIPQDPINSNEDLALTEMLLAIDLDYDVAFGAQSSTHNLTSTNI